MISKNSRRRRLSSPLSGILLSGVLIVSSIFFFISIVFFQTWLSNSPPWQARLYGIQTQGIVKSIDDTCNTTSPDPNLDPSFMNGGFVLGSFKHATEDEVLPTIQFTDRQGHQHLLRENYCGTYSVGQQVTVWYLPANPTTFALTYETDSTMIDIYGSLTGMIVFLPCVLGSALLLIFRRIREKRTANRGYLSHTDYVKTPGTTNSFLWKKQASEKKQQS